MPGCEVHQKITEETLKVLCNEFEDFIDLCRLIDGDNRDVLINSVCDPDIRNLADYVIEIAMYCVCDGEEVDIDECNELMSKRRELEQRLSYASSPDERRSIEEELRKIPRCIPQNPKSDKKPVPVKHHGGVNTRLWWYYVYTAAKDCLEANKGISDKARECMKRLARALHYAQDGPITRHIKVEGVYDIYTVQIDKLHDIFEEGITEIIRREINNFDIFTPIREGVNMAQNEKAFTISRKLSSTEETSIVNAMKAMFRNTAYTFTKFIQIIRFIRREGKKIQQLYMLYRALQIAGYVAIASLILLVLVSPHILVQVLLALIGSSLIASSNLLYIKIRPMLCLYINIDCEGYKKSILTERTERGRRTIIRKYRVP
jgi:hypothetical protein